MFCFRRSLSVVVCDLMCRVSVCKTFWHVFQMSVLDNLLEFESPIYFETT